MRPIALRALAVTLVLTAALSARLHAAPPKKAAKATPTPSLAGRVDALEREVRTLRQELVTLAAVANFRAGEKAAFDPARPAVARLDTDVGPLVVTIEPLETATGGSRVVLVVGNPGVADVGGAQAYVSWGKRGVSWSDASPSTTLVPPNDLPAGAWTRLATFLPDVTPADVGWIEVRMSASAIRLKKP